MKRIFCLLILYIGVNMVAQCQIVPDNVAHTFHNTIIVENNVRAVDLMMQAQTEDETSLLKDSLLTEQLKSLHGVTPAQRLMLERQLVTFRVSDSLRKVTQQHQIDSLRRTAAGAPVILKRDTVLYIYTKFGSFSPAERAQSNSEKLLQIARIYSLDQDSLVIIEGGTTSDILFGEIPLMSISDMDALWMDTSRDSLAMQYRELIIAAIAKYKQEVGIWNKIRMIGVAALMVLVFIGLVIGVRFLFVRLIDNKIRSKRNKLFKGIKIHNIEILSSGKEKQVGLLVSRWIRYIVYLILLFMTLPLLFSVFPGTQHLTEVLWSWIITPLIAIKNSFVAYLPNLVRIIIILVIVRFILRFLRHLTSRISDGTMNISGFYPDWAKATFNIVRIFIYAFALILIYPLLPDSGSPVFQGVSVFMGLIISLGSTSAIANIIAGLVITYMRPFKIGDRIRIGDIYGDVIEKSLFVVRVKTVKKEIVTVPNATILTANVINYSTSALEEDVILYATVSVGYDVPWRQVNQLLVTAAMKTDCVLQDPVPFVLQLGLNDFSASYQINVYTKKPELQARIYSDLNQNIQDVFIAAGIDLINPYYEVNKEGGKLAKPLQDDPVTK